MVKVNKRFKDLILLQGNYIIYSFIIVIGKLASKQNMLSFKFILLFGLELLVFAVYAVMWQQVMKRMELTIAYSSKGIVVLWTLLWSWLLFNESIKHTNMLGAFIILFGIYVVMSDE